VQNKKRRCVEKTIANAHAIAHETTASWHRREASFHRLLAPETGFIPV